MMRNSVGVGGIFSGRAYFRNQMKEAMLDAGHKVMVCKKESITIQSRKKHLTLIETIPMQITGTASPQSIIYDEPWIREWSE